MCRWLPDGRALAHILRQGDRYGVYAHDLGAGGGRSLLAALEPEPDLQAGSFAISPDGSTLIVSFREEFHALMLAEGVAALGRAQR